MARMSRTTNTLINTVAGFVTRIANMTARFMLQTALIYVLGIQYTGISGLFASILTILSLAELGISNAIAFELYRPLEEHNEKRIAALMNFYKSAYNLVALIVLVIGLLIIPLIDFFVKDVPDIKESIILIYVMYILKTVFSYLLIYKSTLLVANQQNYIVSKVQAIVCLGRTVLECIILILTQQYITYLVIEIVGTIVQNLWISHLANNQHPELKKHSDESLTRAERKKMLVDIKGLAMYKASFALGSGVDNIIVSAFVNTATVGLVSNYTMIRKELEQLIKQFYNAVIPSVGNLSVTATNEKQHKVFSNLLFIDFWISSFCSISFFVIIQPFITLWLGEKYLLSITIAAVIAIDFYLTCMLNPISSFRTANGVFIKGQYRPLIMTIINVFLSIVLGYKIGIVGVFAATVISRMVTQWYDPFLLYELIFKRSPVRFYFKYYTYLLFTIACATLVYTCASLLPVTNIWIILIVRTALCVVVPNALIITFYHRTDEFHHCVNKITRMMSKIVNKIRKR